MSNNLVPEENGDGDVLRNRVQELERRVGEQDTEINNLKTQLADCVKRLSAVETRSPAVSKANSHTAAPKKPTESAPVTARPAHSVASSNDHPPATAAKKPASAAPAAKKEAEKKEKEEKSKEKPAAHPPVSARDRPRTASAKTGAASAAAAGDKAAAGKAAEKEAVVNKEEGSVKMWLRGRPLLYYAPTPGSEDAAAAEAEAARAKEAPAQKLKLNWVYGFRGKDCRSNVLQLPTKEVVYFVAATVVLYNPASKTQRHYIGHTDDIKCIALHPDKITLATGQVAGHDKTAGKAHVRVWNSMNLSTLAVFGSGAFERAVSCLSFSRLDNGALLAVHDEGNEHSLFVWDWQKNKKVAEAKASGDQILSIEWSSQEAGQLASVGKGGVFFWFFDAAGGALAKKQGIFEKQEKPKCILCATYLDSGDLLTGDTSGSLFVWPRGQQKISAAAAGAHEGGVFALALVKDEAGNVRVISGGKDRKLALWDAGLVRLSDLTIGEQFGYIRTVTPTSEGELLVGTVKNFILSGKPEGPAEEFKQLVSGHSDELWGLAVHPQRHQFLTACYDKSLILWDALTHSAIWTKELNDPAHSAAFHPSGEVIAVGTKTARWMVVELATRETLASHTDGNEQIECLEYSPDGNFLAVGSRDNFIYVYQVAESGRKYTKIGKCSGHSSFVTHINWSADSQYLESNSGDYEHLFWTAATCKQVTSALTMRDVKWATAYCPFAYSTIGVWPEGSDGTDINNCARANALPLMATADDFGKVNLYNYPSNVPRAVHTEYVGHSSHVTNVRFLFDDSRLISTGGKDMGVFEWELQA